MSQSRPPPENPDKAGGSAAVGTNPMERFKSLTRSLLKVSREQLEEQQRKHGTRKTSKHKDEPTPT